MIESNYVELRTHSAFSLLTGTSSPEALVAQASVLGMSAIALTDHNNVYGAMPFQQTALGLGIQPILGAELTLEGKFALPLLVQNETGWENLCWLITQAQHQAPKGEGKLCFEQLEGHTDGLIALSGGREGEITHTLKTKGILAARQLANRYRSLFGNDGFWIELHHHRRPYDRKTIDALVTLAKTMKLGYVATNHVHYANPEDKALQDVVTAIRHNRSLDTVQAHLFPNGQHYLKSGAEMQTLFHKYPLALENTLRIAEQCTYQLPSELQSLPQYPTPDGKNASDYLVDVCQQSTRYHSDMESRLQHELSIISEAGLANYFLVIWDIVCFSRDNQIRCQGRGSAANSLVAYLLKITPIDPIEHRLVFERFLSAERRIAPDIDMDFDADERERVIQYLYEKYGRHAAAMACTFVTYRHRSVIRDVAKAWGFSPGINPLLKDQWEQWQENPTGNLNPQLQSFFDICGHLINKPRHLGIHNGGSIISDMPLAKRLPTEPATMKDRTVVQWDKEALEDAGIIKIDVLGLKMLAAISEMVERTGVDIDSVGFDDAGVYKMISSAKTFGVFQVESRAQMNTLPRLQPEKFLDLVIAISLIRPGPVMGNMVHPYLRRRQGVEDVTYLNERLKPALEETLGVILWQEQVLKVAHDIANFTHGQGELLRRALGSKFSFELLAQLETVFIRGAVENGVEEAVAQAIFEQLRGFGAYSFAKSHAASFAVLTYQSAWFKRYHPAIFYAAILNHQPMGFWSSATLVYDAKRNGISVYPPDIYLSEETCSIEGRGFRIGLSYVKGLKGGRLAQLLEARQNKSFENLQDFLRRVDLPLRLVERLIQSGAMDSWHESRHQLIWDAGVLHGAKGSLALEMHTLSHPLPETTAIERLNMEFAATGLSTQHHPMQYYRAWCEKRRIYHSLQVKNAPDDMTIQVAGMVIIIQAPQTANGVRFVTLEDEHNLINVIVFPDVYKRYRKTLRNRHYLRITGTVQHAQGVTNVIAGNISALPLLQRI